MHRLPFDIIREHIIPYTYKPQPKSLCRDIETFVAVKNALYDIYDCGYIGSTLNYDMLMLTVNGFFVEHMCPKRMNRTMRTMFMMNDIDFYDSMNFFYKLRKRPMRTELNIKLSLIDTYDRLRLYKYCKMKKHEII